MDLDDAEDLPRRGFMRAAVATGGMSALAACMARSDQPPGGDGSGDGGTTERTEPAYPRGPEDPSTLPERQYAWGEYMVTDARGNPVFPEQQAAVFFDYTGSDPPTAAEREQVETALRTVERAFQRGTGGDASDVVSRGLLFSFGYSPTYFDRFDESLHDSVDLMSPEAVLEELDDDPSKARNNDAALFLASDVAEVVLATEEALLGNVDHLNGLPVEATFEGVFERADRRAGFIGRGLPSEKIDNENISDASPLSMGFKSAFADALPGEDRIAIEEGPFAEGTTQQLARLNNDLESWYELDKEERIDAMFSPELDHEDIGVAGDQLGKESRVTEEMVENIEDDAREKGVVGHSQKVAQARDENFDPLIMRRGEFLIPDGANADMNFSGYQEAITDFVETRAAMQRIGSEDGDDPEVAKAHDGILNHIDVVERATFLVPPRSRRALPEPR